MTAQLWRFTNAPARFDQEDENKFRRDVEDALTQVSRAYGIAGGTGSLEIDSAGAIVAAGVNVLNLSNEFVATVTQSSPTVVVAASLATTQPAAHTWSALQTMPGGIAGPLTMSGGAITVNPGPLVVGVDPGGGNIVRVGGNINTPNTGGASYWARNAAGTADVGLLGLDSGNNLNLGRDGNVAATQIFFGATQKVSFFDTNTIERLRLTTAALTPASSGGLTHGTAPLPWGASFFNALMTVQAGGLQVTAGNVGVGAAPIANAGVIVTGATLSGQFQDAFISQATIGTGASTGNAATFVSNPTTAAATWTLPSLLHFVVSDAVKGAGSTITTQYGLYVSSLAAGATNYAIFTNAAPVSFGDATTIRSGGLSVTGGVAVGATNPGDSNVIAFGTGASYLWSNVAAANSFQRFGLGYGLYWNTTNANYTITDVTFNQASFTDENGTFSWYVHSGALTSPQTYAQWGAFQRMFLGATQLGLVGVDLNFNATATGVFDNTMTRFGGGAAPAQAYDVWSYDGTASKWRPRFLQTNVSTGVLTAGANGDGTFSVFAFDGRALSGTSIAGPTPTVTAIYGGFIVDMGTTPPAGFAWDIEWTNSANGNTGGPVRVTSQKMVFQFFSANSTVPFGTTATTFQFKVSQTGGTAAVYGTLSAALAPSLNTEVNAFGLIVASQIACVNLAAISADLGIASAGVISDAIGVSSQTRGIFIKPTAFQTNPGTNWTRGIILADSATIPAGMTKGLFLGSANPMPGTVAYGIDLTATGSSLFIKTPNFTVDGSGNVVVNGALSVQAGTSSTYSRVSGSLLSVGGYNAAQTPNGTLTATIASLAVGANAWNAAGRGIRFIICGRVQAQSSGGNTIKIRLCYGGTTAAFNLFTSGAITDSLTTQAFMLTGSIGVTNGAGAWGQCTAIQSLGNVNATSIITGLNNTIGGSTSNGITAATLFLVWDATGSGGATDNMMIDSAIIEYVGT